MRVMFQIEYVDKKGDTIETLSCVDLNDPEHRKMMHEVLDEYMNNEIESPSSINKFWIGGQCICHK